MEIEIMRQTDDYLEDVVADGEVVRIPTSVMDAAARDAVRSARARWIRQMTDAWKTDARRRRRKEDDDEVEGAEGQNETDPDEIGQSSLSVRSRRGAADARMAARDEYIQRTTSAWRTPIRDAAEPDSGSPEGLMRRHLRGGDNPDASAAEKAWRQRNAQLESAWRGGTDVTAAGKIEAQRERWLGKK
jgi:hypothetical protein